MIIDFIYDHMVHPIMEPLIVLMQSSNNHCLNNLSNIERERERGRLVANENQRDLNAIQLLIRDEKVV